ncbi:MAG TPA: response regulator transcription factor [Kiritimatiellia bacterium]|nr:response regulator transcription factor [Kiritimatiellia bacterium]
MKNPKVVIVEDDQLLASLLRDWIVEKMGWEVLGIASRGEEVGPIVSGQMPDMVILDLDIPDMDGVDLIRYFQKDFSGIKIVVLSCHSDPFWVQRVMAFHVPCYIIKTSPLSELEQAMRAVMDGGKAYDDEVIQALDRLNEPDAFHKILTPRETSILSMLGGAKQDEEIAEALGISIHTVAAHRRNLRMKLGGHNDRDLIRYARKWGIPAQEEPGLRQAR